MKVDGDSMQMILGKIKKMARMVAQSYSNQYELSLEEFLDVTLRNVLPPNMLHFKFVVNVIEDLARAEIMGINIPEEKMREHISVLKTHAKELLEQTIDVQLPPDLEKFRKYGPLVIVKVAGLRHDSRVMLSRWKVEGGDLDEYLHEESQCKCGECDPNGKPEIMLAGVVADMARNLIMGVKTTDELVEGWLKTIQKAFELLDKRDLLKNITLN